MWMFQISNENWNSAVLCFKELKKYVFQKHVVSCIVPGQLWYWVHNLGMFSKQAGPCFQDHNVSPYQKFLIYHPVEPSNQLWSSQALTVELREPETTRAINWQGIFKLLASFKNHEEACNMLCGKGRVRTQDLGYQSGALWPLCYTPGRGILYFPWKHTNFPYVAWFSISQHSCSGRLASFRGCSCVDSKWSCMHGDGCCRIRSAISLAWAVTVSEEYQLLTDPTSPLAWWDYKNSQELHLKNIQRHPGPTVLFQVEVAYFQV